MLPGWEGGRILSVARGSQVVAGWGSPPGVNGEGGSVGRAEYNYQSRLPITVGILCGSTYPHILLLLCPETCCLGRSRCGSRKSVVENGKPYSKDWLGFIKNDQRTPSATGTHRWGRRMQQRD